MNVLTLNCGSSSVKYQLINTESENVLCQGIVERIGIDGTRIVHKESGNKHVIEPHIPDHKAAIDNIIGLLTDKKYGTIQSLDEIDAIGHRLVHGGDKLTSSVLIDDHVMNILKECIDFAPLHNPANIKGVEAAMAELPGKPNVGVFDTAFHSTMPPVAYTYGIPKKYLMEHSIRRYGFHGTSHYYVAKKAAEMMEKPFNESNIITIHLGNGASVTAIKDGKSVDTSMGFTPLEGLIMGTRCGDVDPGVLFHISKMEDLEDEDEMNNFFNKNCGMLGITGKTSDMRDIEDWALEGDAEMKLALDIYCYRIKKYVGSYMAVLNRTDAIVFTGGVGENSDVTREWVLQDMDFLGIKIDPSKNNGLRGKAQEISTADSKVKVFAIPTNEELVIAQETEKVLSK
ncbi:MAG: acetate kinase [Candidatus Marinimicrobia bacterium]|nr:acetate kinase [Candidatus Neomarinimicrobiota bacterium]